jgi:uncharacterized coiled-coil protein SlyX
MIALRRKHRRCILRSDHPVRPMTELSRLETIEIKLAHLEHSLQELGETVTRQQRDIEALSARNRELKCQLEMLEGGEASAGGFETPPHY